MKMLRSFYKEGVTVSARDRNLSNLELRTNLSRQLLNKLH